MRTTRSPLALLALTSALLLMLTVAGAASGAGGRPFHLELTGAAERPNPGDLDGTGTASLWLNPGLQRVCWEYSVSGVVDLTAAHIHVGSADVAGPVVIPTLPSSPTGGSGCIEAERSLIIEIIRNPSNYYFNAHNADFPPGALRAQLG
jgi:hypothetical protein